MEILYLHYYGINIYVTYNNKLKCSVQMLCTYAIRYQNRHKTTSSTYIQHATITVRHSLLL